MSPQSLKQMTNINNSSIPNAISTDALNQIMQGKHEEVAPTTFGGMTIEEVVAHIVRKEHHLHDFKGDAQFVDKVRVLLSLKRLSNWHFDTAAIYAKEGDHKTANAWNADGELLQAAERAVKAVQIGENDGWYVPFTQEQQSAQAIEQAQAAPAVSADQTARALGREPASAPVSEWGTPSLSDESQEVLDHFGPEAPALLNKYSCALEDALIALVKENNNHRDELAQLKGEYAANLRTEETTKALMAVQEAKQTMPKR